ncbi:uncharacterized protein LOC117501209 [Thalassophryne amazonica]|uniref:uncharacterized protein LOC117501209 n=1 Tax=Thalassophryne amazonica TaxID=390379 RepID=UPI001470D8F3|nr:uncharacterized protein LOC117501209 [Thalassophryne amazonica]
MPAICADDTFSGVTYEPKDEAHLSEVQVCDEGEKEDEMMKTATAELMTSNLKETTTPDASNDTQEPSLNTVARVPKFSETTEVVTALMKCDQSEMEEGECVGVMMCEQSGLSGDGLENQAQLDHVDTKSEQTNVDTVFEVGVTEATKGSDDHHEMENTKEEGITEESLENFPEALPECTVVQSVHMQQEVLKLTNVQTEATELIFHKLSEENQKMMQDSSEIIPDPQAEEPEVTKAEISLKCNASQDHNYTRDIQGNLNAFISHHIKSSVTTKAATCSESLSANIMEAQSPQKDQIYGSEPSHSASVVPQNSALVSSTGNEKFRSSLSLELTTDTQFGQLKAETVKQTDTCQVLVQTVEHMKQTNAPEEAESQKPTEISSVAVQETETSEATANLDSTEPTVIKNQLSVKDVVVHVKELMQEVQQTKSVERVIPVQPETTKIQETEAVQETEAAESAPQSEEAYELDVWLDAEEDTDAREPTDVSLLLKHDTQVFRAEMAIVEPEFEMAPECHTAEGTEPEMEKTGGRGDCEGEGEDLTAACEHPETTTESITTAECD